MRHSEQGSTLVFLIGMYMKFNSELQLLLTNIHTHVMVSTAGAIPNNPPRFFCPDDQSNVEHVCLLPAWVYILKGISIKRESQPTASSLLIRS